LAMAVPAVRTRSQSQAACQLREKPGNPWLWWIFLRRGAVSRTAGRGRTAQ